MKYIGFEADNVDVDIVQMLMEKHGMFLIENPERVYGMKGLMPPKRRKRKAGNPPPSGKSHPSEPPMQD